MAAIKSIGDTADKTLTIGLLGIVVFTALARGATETWAIRVFEAAMLLALLLWAIKMNGERKLEIIIPKLALPIASLALLGMVQSVVLADSAERRSSLSMDVKATRTAAIMVICLLVAFVLAANCFNTRRRLQVLANFLVIYGCVLAAAALVQYSTRNDQVYWSGLIEGVTGPFGSRNQFAGYIELLVPLPIALVAVRVARGKLVLFYGAAAAVMGVAVVGSLSRGGLISMVAELIFVAVAGSVVRQSTTTAKTAVARIAAPVRWFPFRVRIVVLIGSAIICGALVIGADPVIERVTETAGQVTSTDPASDFTTGRKVIWKHTLAMIAANPVLGVGLGAFEAAYPAYSGGSEPRRVKQAHNDYLQLLADGGLVGGLIGLWFIAGLVRLAARGLRSRDATLAAIALGGAAGIFGMLVHSLFDFNLQIPSHALLFLFLVAIVFRTGEVTHEQRPGDAVTRAGSLRLSKGDVTMKAKKITIHVAGLVLIAGALAPVAAGAPAGGAQERRQQPKQYQPPPQPASDPVIPNVVVEPNEDYRIGPGDVIEVQIEDAPELSRIFRISADGTFAMPVLGIVRAGQRTTRELASMIADRLRGSYLENPFVSIQVRQINSRTFFVQGAVRRPGVYQIEGRPSLLKLITVAGGLSDNHGSTAFIIREIKRRNSEAGAKADAAGQTSGPPPPVAQPQPTGVHDSQLSTAEPEGESEAEYELLRANIYGLLKGNFEENLTIEPGDIIHLPPTDVFFVAGEVNAPGSFPLKEGTTLRQAISLAQGTTFKAATSRAVIFRDDSASGKRQEIRVDAGAVMNGKKEDIQIMANDIIIVPNSRLKSVGDTLLRGFGVNLTRIPLRY